MVVNSCQTNESKNDEIKASSKEDDRKSVEKIDKEMASYMNDISLYKELTHIEVLSKDTFEYSLFVEGDLPKVLKYSIKNDEGKPEGFEFYFFDKKGKVFANFVPTKINEGYGTIISNNESSIILYTKYADSISGITKCDSISFSSTMSVVVFSIKNSMQFFDQIKYMVPNMPEQTLPILTVVKNTVLKENPSKLSSTILSVNKNTHLLYLGSSKNRDSLNGQNRIWYNVETIDKHKGWIFGDPNYIDMLTDENWDLGE